MCSHCTNLASPPISSHSLQTDMQMYLYDNSDDDIISETDLITPNSWNASWPVLFVLIWPTSVISLLLTLGVSVAVRWGLFPVRVQPGVYNTRSWFYFRLWVMDKFVDITLESVQVRRLPNSLYYNVFRIVYPLTHSPYPSLPLPLTHTLTHPLTHTPNRIEPNPHPLITYPRPCTPPSG